MAEYLAEDTIRAEWGGNNQYVMPGYAEPGYFFDPEEADWEPVENG